MMRLWLRRLLWLSLLGGAGWGYAFVRSDAFAMSCREYVENELETRGIFMTLESIRVELLGGGLVARGIEVFGEKEHRTLLARVDRLNVDLDMRELVHRRVKVQGVDLREANLKVPLDPDDVKSEKIELRRLSARVLLDDDRVEIRRGESQLYGLRLSVSGSLLRPPPPATEEEERLAEQRNREMLKALLARRNLIVQTAKLLKNFETARSPKLVVEVSGDLGKPEELNATLHLTADGLHQGDYVCDELELRATYAGRMVDITRLHLRDHLGTLSASGTYEIGGPVVDFHLRSGVDLPQLAAAVFGDESLREVSIYRGEPVEVTADGRVLLGEAVPADAFVPLECTGQVHVGKFASRGDVFMGLSMGFGLAPAGCYFRDVLLRHKSGTLGLQAMWKKPEGLRYRALMKMDPNVFLRFGDMPNTRQVVNRFTFSEQSGIFGEVEGEGPELNIDRCMNRGHVDLRNFKYRGAEFVHVEGDVEFQGRQHAYRNVRVERAEGSGVAREVRCDDDARTVKLDGVVSDLDPAAVVRCFDQVTADVIARYRFDKHPHAEVDGVISGEGASDLRVRFRAPGVGHYKLWGDDYVITRPVGDLRFKGPILTYDVGGLVAGKEMKCKGAADLGENANDYNVDFEAGSFPYSVFSKPLPFEKLRAKVACKKGLADFDLRAKLLDGDFSMRGKVDDRREPQPYEGEIRINAVNFKKFGRIYSPEHDTEGDLTGHAEFTGKLGDWRALKGKGAAVILNGNLYAIPVIGPLTPLLGALLPRPIKGFNVAKEADATFTLEDGFLTTPDFVASTSVFNITAKGQVDYLEDRIQFHAQVKFGKILGLVLFPVSKILEYTGEGTVGDPRWRARFFSASDEKTPFRKPGGAVREQPKPAPSAKGKSESRESDGSKPRVSPPGR